MAQRHKLSKSGSKRLFAATGSRTHRKNVSMHGPGRMAMRGGIRL